MKALKQASARNQRGFTLIEVMIVVAILGVLATLVVVNIGGAQDTANINATKSNLQAVSQALDLFKLDNYRYPTSSEGLEALVSNPGTKPWRGPYVEAKELMDPWDGKFRYESDGKDVRIFSNGADGQEGTEDDLSFPEPSEEVGAS